ncbi:hypothetical protein WA026_002662 [Henosepilachna vigintioctopunctata]|uniref:Uncharacterized protein n=1 Tax=Henosepilachna vigintioctopunctata TaxID=420089 RepID=A0AAW1U2A7_9CUCU
MNQENVNEQWKRRIQQQQKESDKRSGTPQQQHPHQQQHPQQHQQPQQQLQQQDERQIIRMAQPSKYHVEPVSPPENNHWVDPNFRRFQPQPPQSHMSPLDYVKNRIVEVMRTEDDKKDNQEIRPNEKDRSDSPGDMVIDEEKNETEYQSTASQQPQNAYSSYPFVHKDISVNDPNSRSNEPKPLLSAQYEPLSDED